MDHAFGPKKANLPDTCEGIRETLGRILSQFLGVRLKLDEEPGKKTYTLHLPFHVENVVKKESHP
jgi:hypothetical protein